MLATLSSSGHPPRLRKAFGPVSAYTRPVQARNQADPRGPHG